MSSTRPTARPGTRPGLVLATLVTTQLMIVLDNTVINLALPQVRTALGFSATSVAWVTNAYILTFGGLLLLGGRLGDIVGRKALFTLGVALFTGASFAGGAASSESFIVAARAVQGIGAALTAPNALAILLGAYPAGAARDKALGLFFAMSAAGGAIGLLVGGALTSLLSWRWVFWINVPFGVAVLLATVVAIAPTTPGDRRDVRLDLVGTPLATLGVGSLVYAFIRAGDAGWADGATLTAFAAAAVLIGAFIAVEARTTQPLLPLRLFAGRTNASAYVTMLIVPSVMVGLYFLASQYLQVVAGFSPLRTGVAFLPMSALIFAASRVLPRLMGRYGPRRFTIVGGVALTGAAAWLTQLSSTSSYWGAVLPALVLVGLGGGMLYMPVSSILMSTVRPADTGAASGTLQTMQQVGAALGIAVLVAVFGTTQRSTSNSGAAAYADGVAQAFTVSTVLGACALLLIIVGVRPARPQQQPAATPSADDARLPVPETAPEA